MPRSSLFCLAVSSMLVTANLSQAQDCDPEGHLDIGLVVVNNQLTTGIFNLNDPGQPAFVDPGTRTWGAQFLSDPLDPFFTDDPGFGAVTGSGLAPGSFVGFDVLDDLKYWDGTGMIQFGAVPGGEQLRIKLGGQNRYVGTGTGFQTGFNMAVVGSGGTVHVHAGLFLWGADGNAVPADQDGVEATPGIYLLKLRVKDTDSSISPSAPLYIVFRNGVEGCLHCTALNHVGASLAMDRARTDLTFDRAVDALDFAQFSACATRAGVHWTDPCCQDADLDHDGDIDMNDFGIFQRCYSGPHATVDPDCGD